MAPGAYLTVALPSFGITTAPFNVLSWMLIPGAGAEWSMWPGARMAGLGGPCGRMKMNKIRHSEIAALVIIRRVSWRFAMMGLAC
jgi:hypothetical protein